MYASNMTCCGVMKASKWWYAVGEDGRRRWMHSGKADWYARIYFYYTIARIFIVTRRPEIQR